jgi:formamidopyrimidine-DNA glycosylase
MAIEFPEASTIASQMKDRLLGRTFARVEIRPSAANVIKWGFSNLDKVDIVGKEITGILHYGDEIHIQMWDWHLMFGDLIGKLLYHAPGQEIDPKARIVFHLDDGAAFSYLVSLYGYARVLTTPEEIEKFIREQGISPLDEAFTPEYMANVFSESKRKIAKQNNIYGIQYKAGGICNGYWQDVLFKAGVLPTRKSASLTEDDFVKMHHASVEVISEATEAHGHFDEVDFLEQPGGYRRILGKHSKDQPCPRCGGPITVKNLLGSTSYYCLNCQH